jgi:hypothetical protein
MRLPGVGLLRERHRRQAEQRARQEARTRARREADVRRARAATAETGGDWPDGRWERTRWENGAPARTYRGRHARSRLADAPLRTRRR